MKLKLPRLYIPVRWKRKPAQDSRIETGFRTAGEADSISLFIDTDGIVQVCFSLNLRTGAIASGDKDKPARIVSFSREDFHVSLPKSSNSRAIRSHLGKTFGESMRVVNKIKSDGTIFATFAARMNAETSTVIPGLQLLQKLATAHGYPNPDTIVGFALGKGDDAQLMLILYKVAKDGSFGDIQVMPNVPRGDVQSKITSFASMRSLPRGGNGQYDMQKAMLFGSAELAEGLRGAKAYPRVGDVAGIPIPLFTRAARLALGAAVVGSMAFAANEYFQRDQLMEDVAAGEAALTSAKNSIRTLVMGRFDGFIDAGSFDVVPAIAKAATVLPNEGRVDIIATRQTGAKLVVHIPLLVEGAPAKVAGVTPAGCNANETSTTSDNSELQVTYVCAPDPRVGGIDYLYGAGR